MAELLPDSDFPFLYIIGNLILKFPSIISINVPYKATAEISKIGILYNRRLIVDNDGSQNESNDGATSGWNQRSIVEIVGAIIIKIFGIVVVVEAQ